jgi:hypothetical protein
MDDNLLIIKKEFELLKGQFVITESWLVERFVAIGSDRMDYYYVTYNGRKFTWNTCVGRIIPLKNKIDDKHYKEFIRLAQLNHFDQMKLWLNDEPSTREIEIQKHKTQLMSLKGKDVFLTEVCWDLN